MKGCLTQWIANIVASWTLLGRPRHVRAIQEHLPNNYAWDLPRHENLIRLRWKLAPVFLKSLQVKQAYKVCSHVAESKAPGVSLGVQNGEVIDQVFQHGELNVEGLYL